MTVDAMEDVGVLEEEAEAMEVVAMEVVVAMQVMVVATTRRRRWIKLLALRYSVLMLLLLKLTE